MVSIADEVMDVLESMWKSSLIIKVLESFEPFSVMEKKLAELWKPTARILQTFPMDTIGSRLTTGPLTNNSLWKQPVEEEENGSNTHGTLTSPGLLSH